MPFCKTCTYRDTKAIRINSRGLGIVLKVLQELSKSEYERVLCKIEDYAKDIKHRKE